MPVLIARRLTEALRNGVNFSGHFIVAGWGCGTGCTNAAVIDTFTGKIDWPEQFYNVDATYGDGYSDVQLDFKKNSRLLIVHGCPARRTIVGTPAHRETITMNGGATPST